MGGNAGSARQEVDRLREYLRQQATDGEYYFKSKYVASDLGLTPKQVGSLITKLRERETELSIERWGYANATTWRVTLSG
jgi:hypothetical protein